MASCGWLRLDRRSALSAAAGAVAVLLLITAAAGVLDSAALSARGGSGGGAASGAAAGTPWRQVGAAAGAGLELARPARRGQPAGAYCAGLDLMLVQGGQGEGEALAELWALDVGSGRWALAADENTSAPAGRFGHTLTVLRESGAWCDLLLLGGWLDARVPAKAAYVLRVARRGEAGGAGATAGANVGPGIEVAYRRVTVQGWALQPCLHVASAVPAALTRPGSSADVLVFGQSCAEPAVLGNNTVWRLSLVLAGNASELAVEAASWRALDVSGPRPPPMMSMAAAPLRGGALIAVSGGIQLDPLLKQPVSSKQVWLLDVAASKWRVRGPAAGQSFRRHAHGLAALGDDLALFGGERYYYSSAARGAPFVTGNFRTLLVSSPLAGDAQRLCAESAATAPPAVAADSAAGRDLWCQRDDAASMAPPRSGPACRAFFASAQRRDTLVVVAGLADPACSFSPYSALDDAWELNLTRLLQGRFVAAAPDLEQQPMPALVSSLYFMFGLMTLTTAVFALHFLRVRVQRGLEPDAHEAHEAYHAAPARPRGVSLQRILELPEITFRDSVTAQDREMCAICLQEYADMERVLALPCNHLYHRDCATAWLLKSELCPLCKRSVRDAPTEPTPVRVQPPEYQEGQHLPQQQLQQQQQHQLQDVALDDTELDDADPSSARARASSSILPRAHDAGAKDALQRV
jgi:hypothetical protein